MDDETAILAVLPPPALDRFRQVCGVTGAIEPRFDGYTKLVLLTPDRAFLFPRNHTIVGSLRRECAVYGVLDHPLVPRLVGRWEDQRISPYPFFAVTRLAGRASASLAARALPDFAAQLGAALAACHETSLDIIPRILWANAWTEPPPTPPAAATCFSPLRLLGGAERLAEATASFCGTERSARLLDALRATDALAPVLAHGDLHAGHLLLGEDGALTGILDWGFGGLLSPLVDFIGNWKSEAFSAETAYGDLRRHMWAAYAGARTAPLPPWDGVELALAAFDITALAPETRSHYYWHARPEWRAARRTAAGERLIAMLA
jgi:aminoglycoside phosphotransferase (APT) family kinase protein